MKNTLICKDRQAAINVYPATIENNFLHFE